MSFYKKHRIAARLCADCENPLDDFYTECLRCRNKRNDRRSQITFDYGLDRTEWLIRTEHIITVEMAADEMGVKPRTIRGYIARGALTVHRRELNRVWLSRKQARVLKKERVKGYGWLNSLPPRSA